MSARSTDLAVVAKLIAIAGGNTTQALYLAETTRAPDAVRIALKAASDAGSTTDPDFAAALVETEITGAFVEGIRSRSVLARLLADGAVRMPLRTNAAVVIADASAFIVGEGNPVPVSVMGLAGPSLAEHKAAALIVLSAELLRATSPAGRALLDSALKGAVAAAVDAKFLDIVADGLTPIPASGPTAADALADLRALLDTVNVTGGGLLFWIGAPDVANAASTLTATSGELVFPGASPVGGELLGLPFLVTSGLVSGTLMLIDATGVAAEIESITISLSDQASVQMETAPTNPPNASTVLMSLWQSNRVALLARGWFGAEVIRPGAVAVLDGVSWGTP